MPEKPTTQAATAFMGSVVPMSASRYVIGWGGWLTMDVLPSASEVVMGAFGSIQLTGNGGYRYTLDRTNPSVVGHARDERGRSCVVVLLAAWPRRIP